MFDDHSGFSPIAAAVADDIADSFSSKTAVHFPVSRHSAPDGTAPPPQPDGLGALTAAVTGGLTMAALTGASDGALVVPVDASAALGMPHLRSAGAGSPAASAYEGSYALAAALDAVTLPARMGAQPECAGRRPLGALASEARGGMGPVVGLAAAAPCPEVSSLESPLTGLSPGVAWSSAATVSEVLVLRWVHWVRHVGSPSAEGVALGAGTWYGLGPRK